MTAMNEMPPVARCEVEECFYNRESACHAPAINVGGDHPICDTFITLQDHIARQATSSVGACHVNQCRFNTDLTCHASAIEVAHHANHADCNTFQPR
ncbi:MAG: DUF1540 domain-containing protein [Armatimonadota bacterium]